MNALSEADRARIIDRYSERLQKYGIDIRTLNPGSEEKHRLQHSVHATIGPMDGRSVLDIGCGLAHYYQFLKARGVNVNYVGYDIVEPFVEINRERFPEATFEVRDISRDAIIHEPDYVTMCQVFNNRYAGADNVAVVKHSIEVAFKACRVGMSIDMLTRYVNYEEPHLCYFSPEEMFGFAKSLTRFVRIRHDYLPFDFTLILFKEAASP